MAVAPKSSAKERVAVAPSPLRVAVPVRDKAWTPRLELVAPLEPLQPPERDMEPACRQGMV